LMSKHPLDLPVGRKLSREEVAEALRLSIVAELDAINLYLQLARSIDDERIRRVFEDIAREEKTHVGEFLALLKSLDQEQVEELRKGAEEVRGLTGIAVQDPPKGSEGSSGGSEWGWVVKAVTSTVNSVRVFRRYLPVVSVGRGSVAVPIERYGSAETSVVPMTELSVRFRVSQRALEYAESFKLPAELGDAYRAAVEFATAEDRYILSGLLELKGATALGMSSWDEPGSAVAEVSRAVGELIKAGVRPPFVLFVSPARYSKLLAVHERTGVMELQRVKALVSEVAVVPVLPDEVALVVPVSPYTIDVAIGVDTDVSYVGPEDGYHVFRLWETIALRVRYEKGVAVLRQV
jgi:uncharacterized linocin/CFP29 family protein